MQTSISSWKNSSLSTLNIQEDLLFYVTDRKIRPWKAVFWQEITSQNIDSTQGLSLHTHTQANLSVSHSGTALRILPIAV